MWNKIVKLLHRVVCKVFNRESVCEHRNNYISKTYISNGCPMAMFRCGDCGYYDNGPVIMGEIDPDFKETVIVRNGVVINT